MKITIDRSVLEQALDALARQLIGHASMLLREALAQPSEAPCKYGNTPSTCTSSPMDCQCVIDAAISAHPQQEPVAIVAVDGIGQIQVGWLKKPQHNDKLYTSPPARKPLTDDSDRLDWLMRMISGVEFRRIGVYCAGNVNREDIDSAIEAANGITS